MVRNTVDTSFCECGDKVGEDKKVLHPEPGSPFTNCHIGIGGQEVRPAHGQRAERAVGQLEGHPVLSPELFRHDEGKGLPPEGVEGMGDADLSLS